MPAWIHDRAEHLLARNPSMSKSTAFAVATQQSHALGKTPKGYGTDAGKRDARSKYETPGDDVKRSNPGGLDSPKMAGVIDSSCSMGAMTDELIAIMKTANEHDQHKRRGGAMALGGLVGGGAAEVATRHRLHRVTDAADDALYKRLQQSSPVDVVTPEDLDPIGRIFAQKASPYFSPEGLHKTTRYFDMPKGKGLPHVFMPEGMKAPELLAHEIGHADIHGSAGRAIQSGPARAAFGVLSHPMSGALTGAASGFSDNSTAQWAGRWAPAIAAAPTLLSEAGATALGLARMRRQGAGAREMWHGAKTLLPAFGTYVANPAMSTGVAHVSQALVRKHRRKSAKGSD